MIDKRTENLLFIAWGQALMATLGSLFFSEIMLFVPCKLCWIQRILMYPLVIIYGAAIVKKNAQIALPGLMLAIMGIPVAAYHYITQKMDVAGTDSFCGLVPCTTEYINYFGFITIPFLSFVAFTVIVFVHTLALKE
ncbi:MAG: disulfide bond formation protein B [Bacillaceae bacterium]|nr:disulfide bond formation protein B [Bacillaceae bacterium]